MAIAAMTDAKEQVLADIRAARELLAVPARAVIVLAFAQALLENEDPAFANAEVMARSDAAADALNVLVNARPEYAPGADYAECMRVLDETIQRMEAADV